MSEFQQLKDIQGIESTSRNPQHSEYQAAHSSRTPFSSFHKICKCQQLVSFKKEEPDLRLHHLLQQQKVQAQTAVY